MRRRKAAAPPKHIDAFRHIQFLFTFIPTKHWERRLGTAFVSRTSGRSVNERRRSTAPVDAQLRPSYDHSMSIEFSMRYAYCIDYVQYISMAFRKFRFHMTGERARAHSPRLPMLANAAAVAHQPTFCVWAPCQFSRTHNGRAMGRARYAADKSECVSIDILSIFPHKLKQKCVWAQSTMAQWVNGSRADATIVRLANGQITRLCEQWNLISVSVVDAFTYTRTLSDMKYFHTSANSACPVSGSFQSTSPANATDIDTLRSAHRSCFTLNTQFLLLFHTEIFTTISEMINNGKRCWARDRRTTMSFSLHFQLHQCHFVVAAAACDVAIRIYTYAHNECVCVCVCAISNSTNLVHYKFLFCSVTSINLWNHDQSNMPSEATPKH